MMTMCMILRALGAGADPSPLMVDPRKKHRTKGVAPRGFAVISLW